MSLIEKALTKKESESQGNKFEPAENKKGGKFSELEPDSQIFHSINSKTKRWRKILIISLGIFLILGISPFIIGHLKKIVSTGKTVPLVTKSSSKQVITKKDKDRHIAQLKKDNHTKKTIVTNNKETNIKTSRDIKKTKVTPSSKRKSLTKKNSTKSKNFSKFQNYYTVQIGSFRYLKNAKAFLKTIFTSRKDICPHGRIEKIGGIYAVRCGLYKKRQKAILLKKTLLKQGRLSGIYNALVISTLSPTEINKRVIPPLKTPNRAKTIPKKNIKRKIRKKIDHKPKKNIDFSFLLKEAYSYLKNGDLNRALILYNQILETDPSLVDALINRAIIWQRIGELEKAKKDLKLALNIEQNKKDPIVLNALGVIYFKQNRYQRAKEYFLKAGDTKAMINLAILFWEKGEFKKVIEYLNKAYLLTPDDPYVHYYLGLYYQQQHENSKANKEFAICKQLAEEKGAFDILKMLKR
ncbi:tetratricopeptide repeat protein [Desulfothermus sp.]